jgi:hypothetical protein
MRATSFLVGLACASGLLLAATGPALAGVAGDGQPALRAAPRAVMQCGADSATRRAFVREHGSAPVFVTAREARAAVAAGEIWSAPRCMTAREHARLVQTAGENASTR